MLNNIDVLVSYLMNSKWYWIIGLIFFLFRKKLLVRYGETFHDGCEDKIWSYIQCVLIGYFTTYLIDMFIGNESIGWEEILTLVVYGIGVLAMILNLLLKACHFDVLLAIIGIYVFAFPIVGLVIIKRMLPESSSSFGETSADFQLRKINKNIESIDKSVKDEIEYRSWHRK